MNFVSNDNSTSLFTEIGNRLRKRPSTFTGTTAEWNALTSSEKEQYEIVNITDDYSPSSGGGHTIQDADGTDMSQRDTLQFAGYLKTSDDSGSEKTIVDDSPTPVTWEVWQTMTDQQKEGTKWLITGVPEGGGGSSSGHIIEDKTGTDLTQRDTLQFKGGLRATDDSTNGKTIIDDTPVYYTWEQWNAMTPAQQADVAKAIVTGVPSSGGSGHTIEDATGTAMTTRGNLQFKGGLKVSDDSTNDRTIIDDSPTEIEWADWIEMTPQEQEAISHAIIVNAPSVDGGISTDLLTKLWENPDPTASFVTQAITLASDDYDFLLFIFTTLAPYQSSTIVKKGSYVTLDCACWTTNNGAKTIQRFGLYNSDTSYTFADCRENLGSAASTVTNNQCIPTAIYGIKKTINLDFSAIASDVSTSADKCMLSDGVTSVEDVLVSRPLITQDSIKAQVKNGILYISTDSVTPPSVGSWALITTLPVGYRPNTSAYFVAIAPASNNAICSAFINPSGEVSIKSNNSYNYVFSGALPIKED